MTERKVKKRVCFSVNRLRQRNTTFWWVNCDYHNVWYFVWYLFYLMDVNGCCTLFLWPLLQTSSSCLRPQVLLSEGSRGQTSDCTPKLCPWHSTATGKHLSGNIQYKVHTINVCYYSANTWGSQTFLLTLAGLHSYGCTWHAEGGSICK